MPSENKRPRSPSPESENVSKEDQELQKKMIVPFKVKHKEVTHNDRNEHKAKALAALSKFLLISDKYTKTWEAEKTQVETHMRVMEKFFNGALREYQKIGVHWLVSLFINDLNGILADEMGLGKTVQVIGFFARLHGHGVNGMHLVIVPLSTLPNWEQEFKRFAPKLPVIVYHGSKDERQVKKQQIRTTIASVQKDKKALKPIILVPQHTITADISFFQQLQFSCIVMDEAHRIKNYKSQISNAMRTLNAQFKLLLTGTPLQNNMLELWSLLNYIMPDTFRNMDILHDLLQVEDFADKEFLEAHMEEQTSIVQTIQRILKPFMLRRLKVDVLEENVPKRDVNIYCQMAPDQINMYKNALLGKLRESFQENEEDVVFEDEQENDMQEYSWGRSTARTAISQAPKRRRTDSPPTVMYTIKYQHPFMLYKRIVNHPYLVATPLIPGTPNILVDERIVSESGKMRVLDAMLVKLLADNHKVLIFSTLCIMLDLIADYLEMRNLPYERLDGKRNVQERQASMDAFNNDPKIQIFLISTRAGGLGVNLTAADTVIFYDRDWNPHVDIQAEARCHRIGQTKPVMVFTLISKMSIDEYILSTAESKLRLEKILLQSNNNAPKEEQLKMLIDNLLGILNENEKEHNSKEQAISNDELYKLMDRTELLREMDERQLLDKKI